MERNNKCVYLDYNATTPLEPEVLENIKSALADAWGNPSSRYEAGKKAKTLIEDSRRSIATMVGGISEDVIFTSGGTEANNMVLHTAVKHFHKTFQGHLKRGSDGGKLNKIPHIITSNLEHDSIKLPLEEMEREKLADVTFVAASKLTGRVEPGDVVAAIRPTTILVTIMTANNETGIIQPVEEISERVRALKRDESCETRRILLHTDAAQMIGKLPVDVCNLGVDYLTIVGHKFYGPRIGALYIHRLKKETPLYPMFFGGGQEQNYRPGTENTGMIAGLGKAAELVVSNISSYEAHMRKIRDYLEKRLREEFKEKLHINGDFQGSTRLPNTCNMSIKGAGLCGNVILGKVQHLQASVGAACHSDSGNRPSPILLAVGVAPDVASNALRLSVGRHTTLDDIDLVVTDIKTAVQQLQRENQM